MILSDGYGLGKSEGIGFTKEGCDLNYPEIPEGWDGIMEGCNV